MPCFTFHYLYGPATGIAPLHISCSNDCSLRALLTEHARLCERGGAQFT